MKQKIEWHQRGLRNMEIYLQKEREVLTKQIDKVNKLKNDVEFLREQIKKAKSEGRTDFDAEKYMVKKNV